MTLTLKDLTKIFVKLGVTGFGGPLAVVEQLRVTFVQELQVMSNQEFNQVFTIMKAMPGPIAFQYSVYFGKRYGGYAGAWIAALGLVLPASLIMICYAIFYDQIIEFEEMKNFMLGVQYAVAGVIAFTVFSLAKPTLKDWKFLALVPLCGLFYAYGLLPEVLIIMLTGLLVVAIKRFKTIKPNQLSLLSVAVPAVVITDTERLLYIAKVFFLAGAFVFGTGLAAFPYFKVELVDELRLLSLKSFNDGLSFAQISPGPVTVASVFYGFRIADWSGALTALIMMYMMPFIHMATWFPKAVHTLAKKTWIQDFTFGATAAIVGCLSVTLFQMNRSEVIHFRFWLTSIVVFGILQSFKKVSIFKVILSFALINYILMMFI